MKVYKVVFVVINIFLVVLVAKLFIADVKTKQVDKLIKNLEFAEALQSAHAAVELNPNEPYYYRQRAKIYILLASQSATDKKVYKNLALNDLEQSLALNTNNLATIRNNIPYYYFLAKADLLQQQDPVAKMQVDQDFIEQTKTFFSKTKTNYDTDAGVITTLAKYEKMLGLTKEYEKSREIIKTLRPELLEWYPGVAY